MIGDSRPEVELLLCCAAPAGSELRAERIRQLAAGPLDWEYLLLLARAHALLPLLYWGLKTHRPEAIPESLARSFQENLCSNMRLTAELLHLLSLFSAEGISLLAFKGPTLAIVAYGNLGLRCFGDLDLLVHKEHALRAREILTRRGFENHLQVSPRREQAYLRAYDEFALLGAGGYPLVELHWALLPRYFSVPLDIAPFWKRAVQVPLGTHSAPTPGTEDTVLAVCVHAAKHCWSHLSLVSDLAWLVASNPVDWKVVLESARALGILRIVLLGVELAHRLLQAPLPETVVLQAEADRDVQALAGEVVTAMFRLDGEAVTIMAAGAFHMKARERWQDRARYFLRLATTVGVEDWQAVDLHPSMAFLYPLVRFPRLLRKYWMRIP